MTSPFDPSLQNHDSNVNAHVIMEHGKRVLILNPSDYPGGIAIWGALPAIFNTSEVPDEHTGVHVHARKQIDGPKQIDETFDLVRVRALSKEGVQRVFEINGEDAVAYNISSIFGKTMKYLECPECHIIHSDKGYNSVVEHLQHTCEHCGCIFTDNEMSISNPIILLQETCGDAHQSRVLIDPVNRPLIVKRNTFKGGMQMWGSNPAVLWTSSKFEEGGVHFHGFQPGQNDPTVDETFGPLIIYYVRIDPEMARYLMAQNALEHLKGKVKSLVCLTCGKPHFDKLDSAAIPHITHKCEYCSSQFDSPRGIACVSNPLVSSLRLLK